MIINNQQIKIGVHRKIGERLKIDMVDFLFTHLDQFRDTRNDITKAIEFASQKPKYLKCKNPLGGCVITAKHKNTIVSAVVINKTGMDGYIPGNILVYIATHADYRGKGIGKIMMKKAAESVRGDIALHVEPDNPARHLYEKLGYTNKYLEMRYLK